MQAKTQWILKVPDRVVVLSLTAEAQAVDSVVDIRLLSSLVVELEDIQVVVNSSSFILGEAFRLECFLACVISLCIC